MTNDLITHDPCRTTHETKQDVLSHCLKIKAMPLQTELQYGALLSDKPHNYIKIYSFINMFSKTMFVSALKCIFLRRCGSDREYLFCLRLYGYIHAWIRYILGHSDHSAFTAQIHLAVLRVV